MHLDFNWYGMFSCCVTLKTNFWKQSKSHKLFCKKKKKKSQAKFDQRHRDKL